MVVGLVTGFWSTNIGNAFFHLGASSLLSRLSSDGDEIVWLNNMPAYWKLFNKSNPRNATRGIGEPHLDVLVMVGPFLRRAFPSIWSEEIGRLKARGTKIVMIGLGAMQHDQETRKVCRRWFEQYRPDFVATRDQATFETLDGLGLNLESALCPAFFVSDAVKVPGSLVDPYVVVNCEKVVEPKFEVSGSDHGTNTVITLAGHNISISPQHISSKTYLERFAELSINVRSFFATESPSNIAGIPLYRTTHRSNPFIFRSLFPRPNTMLSDIPHPYLLAYANAGYIITDRVHTAVAGISYGKPVVFVGKTKRQGLLFAGGATIGKDGIVVVDNTKLASAKERLKQIVETQIFGRSDEAAMEGVS